MRDAQHDTSFFQLYIIKIHSTSKKIDVNVCLWRKSMIIEKRNHLMCYVFPQSCHIISCCFFFILLIYIKIFFLAEESHNKSRWGLSWRFSCECFRVNLCLSPALNSSYGSDDLLSQLQSLSLVLSSSDESNLNSSSTTDSKESNHTSPAWHVDYSR